MALDVSIPFKQARHYHKGRVAPGKVLQVVIHDMEAVETGQTAENVADFFATTTRLASAHYNVDSDSIVQCVKEGDTAFHAPGLNHCAVGVEHAGYARQTRGLWLDTYGVKMLALSAKLVAELCQKYDIPVRRLTVAQVRRYEKGLCGHIDVSSAFGKSSHWDPGPGFPWDVYLTMVDAEIAADKGKPYTAARLASIASAMRVSPYVFAYVTAFRAPDPKLPKPVVKPAPPREFDIDEKTLRAIIREEVASQPVRDEIAGAVLWWLDRAVRSEVPAGKSLVARATGRLAAGLAKFPFSPKS